MYCLLHSTNYKKTASYQHSETYRPRLPVLIPLVGEGRCGADGAPTQPGPLWEALLPIPPNQSFPPEGDGVLPDYLSVSWDRDLWTESQTAVKTSPSLVLRNQIWGFIMALSQWYTLILISVYWQWDIERKAHRCACACWSRLRLRDDGRSQCGKCKWLWDLVRVNFSSVTLCGFSRFPCTDMIEGVNSQMIETTIIRR